MFVCLTVAHLSQVLPASAQAHEMTGVRVALLGATTDPTDLHTITAEVMTGSRGLGPFTMREEPPDRRDLPTPDEERRPAYEIERVDVFDTNRHAVPTTGQLRNYEAVLVYSNTAFAHPVEVGDLVANFVETGRGAVVMGRALDRGQGLQGRFVTQQLGPLSPGAAQTTTEPQRLELVDLSDLWTLERGDPLLRDVVMVEIPAGATVSTGMAVRTSARVVQRWSSGELGTVVTEPALAGHGRVGFLNLDPLVSEGADRRLMANALLWSAHLLPPPWGSCVEGDPLRLGYREPLLPGADYTRYGTTPPTTAWRCRIHEDCPDGLRCLRPAEGGTGSPPEGQDLNCNGLDVSTEWPVDDPTCDHDNTDHYWDYASQGCTYDVTAMDTDGDGYGEGSIFVFHPELGLWDWVLLTCDNAPGIHNPAQLDWDLDRWGDVVDNCPYVPQGRDQRGDVDNDGFGDICDNCMRVPNPGQRDTDRDGFGDACDTCPLIWNPELDELGEQLDLDQDGVGDICDNCRTNQHPDHWPTNSSGVHSPYHHLNRKDSIFFVGDVFDVPNADQPDRDGDGWGDACDVCPDRIDPRQLDADLDGIGDACDTCPGLPLRDPTDVDGDGVGDGCDVCPTHPDPGQGDMDLDGVGDACDNCAQKANRSQSDRDSDGWGDTCDVCPEVVDLEQTDTDHDGVGDACDICPVHPDPHQQDRDGDGIGDPCDPCMFRPDDGADTDGDGKGDACDNCPLARNFSQADADGDGTGDACDVQGLRGGGLLAVRGCAHTPWGPGWWVLLLGLWAVGARVPSTRG